MIPLAFFDLRIAAACAIALAPLGFITSVFSARIERIQEALHDTKETAFDALATRDPKQIESCR